MRRLFVLRPEPAAHRTIERALGLGLDAIAVPIFKLEPVEWSAPRPDEFDGLLLTSANAVNMGGHQLERLRNLPVHAVGEATAVAAEVAGFGVASVGKAGVDELLGSIDPGTRLLHLCGEDRRAPDRPSQTIHRLTVYRARAITPPGSLEALHGQVAALHSPRAGTRLAELIDEKTRATIRVAAISQAAADAAGSGWAEVGIAAAPTDPALLALARRLCET
jgi:uroporphyrinogen-III synthase